MIHRDLKPENILLGDYGEVYVADWGIAKLLGHTEIDVAPASGVMDTAMAGTLAGTMMGTIGYAPPEQLGGELDTIGPGSDLFALGVILYEMLTHERPFDGPTTQARLYATLMKEPVPPRVHVRGCPIVLEELCMKLLAKKPEDRPASAEALADEVDAYLEGAKEKARRRPRQ